MTKFHWIPIAVALMCLSGCFIPLGLKPPPGAVESWVIPGQKTPVPIISARLLECGMPWIASGPADAWQKAYGTTWKAGQIMVSKCMESLGYVDKYGDGSAYTCRIYLAESFRQYQTPEQTAAIQKACDPATPAPKPSVEKRLNSPYCKTEWASKFAECQPIVDPTPQKSAPGPVVIPLYDDNRTWKLDEQTRQHNNQQMDQMRKVH